MTCKAKGGRAPGRGAAAGASAWCQQGEQAPCTPQSHARPRCAGLVPGPRLCALTQHGGGRGEASCDVICSRASEGFRLPWTRPFHPSVQSPILPSVHLSIHQSILQHSLSAHPAPLPKHRRDVHPPPPPAHTQGRIAGGDLMTLWRRYSNSAGGRAGSGGRTRDNPPRLHGTPSCGSPASLPREGNAAGRGGRWRGVGMGSPHAAQPLVQRSPWGLEPDAVSTGRPRMAPFFHEDRSSPASLRCHGNPR